MRVSKKAKHRLERLKAAQGLAMKAKSTVNPITASNLAKQAKDILIEQVPPIVEDLVLLIDKLEQQEQAHE